jgi:SagB-type dehydrogenase family enzyme
VSLVLHHRFSADVREVRRSGTRITLDVPGWKALAFAVPTPAIADAIEALGGEGAPLDRLLAIAAGDAAPATRGIDYYLERLRRARLLEWRARRDGAVTVTFRPLASGFGLAEGPPPARPMRLSRFAYVRRDGAALVLESPETPCRAILTGAGTSWLTRVAESETLAPAGDPLQALFWRAGFLEPADDAQSDERATWEFHDRLFHVASRGGRDAVSLGGTYRFADRLAPPPAIAPPVSAESIALPRPEPAGIAARSDRLSVVMDRRRSLREYATEPLGLEQLSEFLFRVARIMEVFGGGGQELMSRPFPSGGSIHEIEFYVAIGAGQGLAAGLYHYRGLEHALERLPDTAEGAGRLLADSARAMGQPDAPPHVLVVLTCRLPRLAWKYEGIAYRVSLVNAGVAVQTMYLVATDMGLAGCANGSGDSRLFAEVTGLDPLRETSIAEFALGRLRPPAQETT